VEPSICPAISRSQLPRSNDEARSWGGHKVIVITSARLHELAVVAVRIHERRGASTSGFSRRRPDEPHALPLKTLLFLNSVSQR
jgi:hypothetical protein